MSTATPSFLVRAAAAVVVACPVATPLAAPSIAETISASRPVLVAYVTSAEAAGASPRGLHQTLDVALAGFTPWRLPAQIGPIDRQVNGTSYNGVASTTSRVETRYDVTGHQIRELVDQAIHGVARPRRAVSLARQVVDSGMLYSWGGGDLNGPTLGISGPGLGVNDDRVVGMDCSSFARYVVFHAFGVQLPRTSGAQWSASVPVRLDRAQPGDLVFPVGTRGVDHVQIYIGDGLIAEQYQSGTPARIIPINPVDEIRRPIGIPL